MNRRGFIANMFGITIAPTAIVKAIASYAPAPVYTLILTSVSITGKKRKLKAKWSCELEQDLQSFHGIDAEQELTKMLHNEIQRAV